MLELPSLGDSQEVKDRTAFNLAVWEQVSQNEALQALPERIETNAFGQIVMSPPPEFEHGRKQTALAILLSKISTPGTVATECPLSTSDGVKAIDVAWISAKRRSENPTEKVLTTAPEICVEVLSPSNSRTEMNEKKSLYFEAGAEEVWFCQRDGTLSIFRSSQPDETVQGSLFATDLPREIE